MRRVTWVVVEEVKSGDWGIGGQRADHRGRPRARGRRSRLTWPSRTPSRRPRGLLPVDSGFADVDGVRIAYEVFGEGRGDDPPPAAVVDRPLALLEGAGPVPRPPLPRRHLRRPRQRPLRPAAEHRALRAARCRRATRSRCSTRPASRTRAWRALRLGRRRALLLAADTPSASAARSSCRPRCRSRRRCPSAQATRSTRSCRAYEGWAKTNRHYWAQDYRGFLEFFFDKCFPEPHSTKQIEDSVELGARDRRPRRSRTRSRRRASTAGGDPRAARRASRARCSSSMATRTCSSRPTAARCSPS